MAESFPFKEKTLWEKKKKLVRLTEVNDIAGWSCSTLQTKRERNEEGYSIAQQDNCNYLS